MDISIEPGAHPRVNEIDTTRENKHDVTDKHLNHARIDQAYSYMLQARGSGIVEKSPGEIKRLRRKIDWWIVPIMFCCYTMQFLDKVSLNVGTRRLFTTPHFAESSQLIHTCVLRSMQLSWG